MTWVKPDKSACRLCPLFLITLECLHAAFHCLVVVIKLSWWRCSFKPLLKLPDWHSAYLFLHFNPWKLLISPWRSSDSFPPSLFPSSLLPPPVLPSCPPPLPLVKSGLSLPVPVQSPCGWMQIETVCGNPVLLELTQWSLPLWNWAEVAFWWYRI